MQPSANKYKVATWILAIVVVILIIMLSMKSNETVSDTFEDLSDKVQDCRMRLTVWNEAHPEGTTTDAAAQADLDAILEDCSDVIEGASEEL